MKATGLCLNPKIAFSIALLLVAGIEASYGQAWNTANTTSAQFGYPAQFMFPSNATTNIGIGLTTAPTAKLQVAGDIIANGGSNASFGGFQSNAGTTKWGFNQSGRFYAGIGGNVYSKGFSTNAIGIMNGSTTAEDVFLYNGNSPNAGYLVLKDNGNVGIGTATPASLNSRSKVLEINASGISATAHPGLVFRSGGAYTALPAWEMLLSSAPSGNQTDFQLIAGTTGRMLVSGTTGNMGIGIPIPAAKLHVAGDVIAEGGASASFGGFQSNAAMGKWGFTQAGRFSAGNGGNLYSRGFSPNAMGIFNGSTTAEDVFLYNNNAPNAGLLVLKAGGNVGIGTVKPVSLNGRSKVLEIAAIDGVATDNPGIVLRSGANFTSNPAWEMLLSAAGTNTDFQLIEGTAGRIFVSGATGNVGIGTTTTSTNRLEVNGNAKVTGQVIIGGSSTTNWLKFATNEYNSGNGAQIYQDNSGNIGFDINSTKNGMFLTHDGSLEIGQQAVFVNEKLVVAGNARITAQLETGSILTSSVTTKVWSIAPDYVFEKDYKLASLEHVEKYLNENKHLPEIPSAKEIKTDGLDLAEMNLKLLKKVEELTLYAIQQDKREQRHEEEIHQLKEAMAGMISTKNGKR